MLWSASMKWTIKSWTIKNLDRKFPLDTFCLRIETAYFNSLKRWSVWQIQHKNVNKCFGVEKKSCVWIHWISRKINNQNVLSWNAKTSICYCSSGGISEIDDRRRHEMIMKKSRYSSVDNNHDVTRANRIVWLIWIPIGVVTRTCSHKYIRKHRHARVHSGRA